MEVVQRIAVTLPSCPCGGHFRPGANPKCPTCGTEFAHQHDVVRRLTDPQLIAMHGACVFINDRAPYRVEIDEA